MAHSFVLTFHYLHRRRYLLQHTARQFHRPLFRLNGFIGHSPALEQRGLEIFLHIGEAWHAIEVSGALKMMIQAAVVQVDGAHNPLPVIADKQLRVDKAGDVLVDFYAGIQQGGIVGLGQGMRMTFWE